MASFWRKLFKYLLFLFCGILLIILALNILNAPIEKPSLSGIDIKIKPNVQTDQNIVKFYREQINPLLDDAEKRNQEAIDRAIKTIHANFDNYRAGVHAFAEDMTDLGTQLGIANKFTQDLWQKYWNKNENSEKLKNYVNAKFKKYIFSEDKLINDLEEVFSQFKSDIVASRNRLFSEMKLALNTSSSPIIFDEKGLNNFFSDVDNQISQMTIKMAWDSVVSSILAFIGGDVVTIMAQKSVYMVLSNAASTIAIEKLAASSGIVYGVVAGGSTGSLVGGPHGTIIGEGVGIIAGLMVEWWISDKFKEKIEKQCNEYLTIVEEAIIKGSPEKSGLKKSFEEAISIINTCQRDVILTALLVDGGGK